MSAYPYPFLCALAILVASCGDKQAGCPAEGDILDTFLSETGETGIITQSGEAYVQDDQGCTFLVQYFTEGWDDIYVFTDTGMYVQTDEGDLFPITNTFYDDFEPYGTFTDLIATSVDDTDLHWNSFTLQSPLAPTIESYVALRNCILDGSCDFLDNRFDLVADPEDPDDQVLQCTAVAPSADMVTSKSSIERTFNYFNAGMDLWFEARYYIVSGYPFSLADFENRSFDQSPGPRIVLSGNKLAIENKFGDKLMYYPPAAPEVPVGEWFTVKVHFRFSTTEDGVIELWQNNALILSTSGINLPVGNSVQNSLETGVTATNIGCVLLVDDVRLSPEPF